MSEVEMETLVTRVNGEGCLIMVESLFFFEFDRVELFELAFFHEAAYVVL